MFEHFGKRKLLGLASSFQLFGVFTEAELHMIWFPSLLKIKMLQSGASTQSNMTFPSVDLVCLGIACTWRNREICAHTHATHT